MFLSWVHPLSLTYLLEYVSVVIPLLRRSTTTTTTLTLQGIFVTHHCQNTTLLHRPGNRLYNGWPSSSSTPFCLLDMCPHLHILYTREYAVLCSTAALYIAEEGGDISPPYSLNLLPSPILYSIVKFLSHFSRLWNWKLLPCHFHLLFLNYFLFVRDHGERLFFTKKKPIQIVASFWCKRNFEKCIILKICCYHFYKSFVSAVSGCPIAIESSQQQQQQQHRGQ